MFTGIVKSLGTVAHLERRPSGFQLAIKTSSPLKYVALGSSIAINGVCLTLTKKSEGKLVFDIVIETKRRTTLGTLKRGEKVNIEPSLKVGDEIGGHLVLGHVDGIGVIKSSSHKVRKADEVLITIATPTKLIEYIAEKGSVAVDGVSLTVAAVKERTFTVALIPHTLTHTTLGMLQKGDRVNIEVDVMMRYLKKLYG